jgi:hypothetical protein
MLWNRIRSFFYRLLFQSKEASKSDPTSLWCVVANVVAEHPVGENKEIRRGTKHFSPGTKVYCYPPLWGDGYEKIKVIGHHRHSRQLVEMVTRSTWLTNWRVKMVYSPFVIERMKGHWDNSKESERMAKSIVAGMTKRVGK